VAEATDQLLEDPLGITCAAVTDHADAAGISQPAAAIHR